MLQYSYLMDQVWEFLYSFNSIEHYFLLKYMCSTIAQAKCPHRDNKVYLIL